MTTLSVPPRGAIAREYTWDSDSIFPSVAAWEDALGQVEADLAALQRFRGRLGEGPGVLADWFDEYQRVFRLLGQVVVYASMHHAVDTTDQEAAARYDRARGLQARAAAAVAFADPEMLAVGPATLRRWAQDPRLALYAHYFARLERRGAHVRSPEVEELLGLVTDPFRTAAAAHGILADADLVFLPAHTAAGEPVEVAQGNVRALLASPDREVRRTAWTHYADAYLAHQQTMASLLAAGVKQNVFLARARRYASALEAALAPNHVPVEVFWTLLATFQRRLPLWHRYWRLRRRVLGYDRLQPYDLTAPLTARMPVVPFRQAVEWVAEGMRPLGDEYVQVLRRGVLEQRWVDVYPNRGKRAGAFSTGAPGTHPFLLMSYNDDIYGLSTLAHELGHSMHSYFAWQAQPLVYARPGIFLAEVASNVNQALVRAYLLASQSDRDLQIAVLEEAMANFYRYFLIMPSLARFELEIHQRVERGGALTARTLNALMADLLAECYGDEVALDPERVGITWATFPTHLYANFYVFQYATGIAGAHALADRILGGAPGAAAAYLAFLRAGSSLFPLDALRLAGVDLATPEPVERAFDVLAGYVERLEALLAPR